MSEQNYTPKKYVDFLSDFSAGMNSGVAPLILDKNQLAFALNVSTRNGFAHCRPAFQKKTLNFNGNLTLQKQFETGLFQGAGYYRPDYGTESLIAQISGRLLLFTESGSVWNVTDISVPGDLNDSTVQQVWMWQSEKWMIIQDGTGKLPIFFDGVSSRRSTGASRQLAITAADFTPPAIGSIVTITLTEPFSAPYNIPVIINGEFYNPVANTSGYSVILTNITGTAGQTLSEGESVVVNPSLIGYSTSYSVVRVTSPAIVQIGISYSPPGFRGEVYIQDSTIYGVGINPQLLNVGGAGNISGVNGTLNMTPRFGGTGGTAQVIQGGTIPVGSLVTDPNTTQPSYVLGKLDSDFVIPNAGESATVNLTEPYSGSDNQVVWIGTNQFLISLVPSPATGTIVNFVNLTDGSTNPVLTGAKIYSIPELPAGRMGAYGMGCNAVSLTDGISYIIGDIVGAASGNPANNYRDAVLKVTQNDFLDGGGSFRLPGTGDIITSMIFPPLLDSSLGQGALMIGTQFSFFSNNVAGTDPAGWASVTFPIQSESLKDKGSQGQNSTILVNSDTFFRSSEGIGSLVVARRDFTDWGNKTVSVEMNRIFNPDNQTLLQFGSSISFDNRFITTASPQVSARGVFHMATASMDLNPLSTMRQSVPPTWDGAWTGLNCLQAVTGRVNGRKRAFAFTFNIDLNSIELYELLDEKNPQYLDNNSTPIKWVMETPVVFNKDVKPLTELVQLRDGELYLGDIKGSVNVKIYYRPDFYPCWTLWNEFDVCQNRDGENSKPGYRMRIGLGEPSVDACEVGNNRPLRQGYFFQYRIEVTGYCIFYGLRSSAIAVANPTFAPVECDLAACQAIDCSVPNDFRIYSLQGLPPQSLPPVVSPPLAYSNEVVYYNKSCGVGQTLVYYGTLPSWITLDQENSRLIGSANTFWSATQEGANELAQNALNEFAQAGIDDDTLFCFECGTTPTTIEDLVWNISQITQPDGVAAITNPSAGVLNWTWTGNCPNAGSGISATAEAEICNGTASPMTVRAVFNAASLGSLNYRSWKFSLSGELLTEFYIPGIGAGTYIFYPSLPYTLDIVIPPFHKKTLTFIVQNSVLEEPQGTYYNNSGNGSLTLSIL